MSIQAYNASELKEQTEYNAQYPSTPEAIDEDMLKVFNNKNPQNRYTIQIDCPEFTSVCPMTGLPDFGTIHIVYEPDQYCIELKSLKYYLLQYRQVGIFYENVVNHILNTLIKKLNPLTLEVKGNFAARGGISSIITANYKQPGQ